MESVAVEGQAAVLIVKFGGVLTQILHHGTAGQHIGANQAAGHLGAVADAAVHLLLIAVIIEESAVIGVDLIRPRLVEVNLGLRTLLSDKSYQLGEIRNVSLGLTAVMAYLLNSNHVPLVQSQSLRQGDGSLAILTVLL